MSVNLKKFVDQLQYMLGVYHHSLCEEIQYCSNVMETPEIQNTPDDTKSPTDTTPVDDVKLSERPNESNPASYTYRDLLLLTQILHTRGLLEPNQVRENDNLDEYGEFWFNHKCTTLSRNQGEFPLDQPATGSQVLELYENLLIDYSPCKNTTELANCFYHLRIKELESKIAQEKASFDILHNMA